MGEPKRDRAIFIIFVAAILAFTNIIGCMRSSDSRIDAAGQASGDTEERIEATGVPPGPNRPPAVFAPAPHPAAPEPAGMNDRPSPVDMKRVDADNPRVVGPRAIGPIMPDPAESDHHQSSHQMQH